MVATQTRVVEVVVDDAGEWIAGVPLVVVLAPHRAPLAAGRRAGGPGRERMAAPARGGHRAGRRGR